MSGYDKQYLSENSLFGSPYPEFEAFVKTHTISGNQALDLGCGQGRDALLLAQYGYTVTGVDTSKVGLSQMLEIAKEKNLAISGVNQDFHEYAFTKNYDAIVMDSILHFEKNDHAKEIALLNKAASHLNTNGYLFIFIHKSHAKEYELSNWWNNDAPKLKHIKDGYIDYVYEEKSTNFRSAFQFYMLFLQFSTML